MNNNTAIVILSFDGYSDLWDDCLSLLDKYWPDNVYEVYLVTNHLSPEFKNVNVIKTGDEVSWSHRAKDAVSKIKEENIIILLEDYFFSEKVNSKAIADLITYTEKNDVDYLRLIPIPKVKTKKRTHDGVYTINEDYLYGVNLQASLWKRDFFLATLGEGNYSAWEYEKKQKMDSAERTIGTCRTLDYWAVKILNGVIQGKWNPDTLDHFSKQGIKIKTGGRAVMTKKEIVKFKVKRKLSETIPIHVQRRIKPLLSKIGFNFVT